VAIPHGVCDLSRRDFRFLFPQSLFVVLEPFRSSLLCTYFASGRTFFSFGSLEPSLRAAHNGVHDRAM
jgi:hypothetical protein